MKKLWPDDDLWGRPPSIDAEGKNEDQRDQQWDWAWEPKPRRGALQYLKLLRYAKPQWPKVSVVLLTMIGLIGLEIAKPWPMKVLVDNVLAKHPRLDQLGGIFEALPGELTRQTLLGWIVAGTLLIFIAITLVTMVHTVVSVSMGQRMTYSLGADLFLHMQRMSLLFHVKRPVGDSIARVTADPYCVQMLVNGALLPLLRSAFTIVAMFYMMWRLDVQLTILSIAVVPFIIFTIHRFKDAMKERRRRQADLEGDLMSVVQQALNGIPLVQAFNREEAEHERFRSFADKTAVAHVRATMTDMWFQLFAGLATAVGTAAMIWVGSRAVIEGRLSLGTLLVFLAYLAALYGPLDQMSFTASTLQHAAAQADRVLDIIEAPRVIEAPDAADREVKGSVIYEEVNFSYEPDREVLKGVSFEARPGETVAIVGPTGAGKSTLVNMLVRFFDPAGGSITIDGVDIRAFKLSSLRDQVAIVLQDPFIFPMTVAENISYGRPDATLDEIKAAAVAANAHAFIDRLAKGYDSIIGERGATLSGGEKQRLSIARAFLKDAPILILDEPTSALDSRTESSLMEAMKRLMRGRVAFVIAHRLSTIRNADQILVLDEGRIVERGTHDELLLANGLYASLYNQQMDIADHDVSEGDVLLLNLAASSEVAGDRRS